MGNDRKNRRRFRGFFWALWLTAACLAGCGVSGGTAGEGGTVRIAGEMEESSGERDRDGDLEESNRGEGEDGEPEKSGRDGDLEKSDRGKGTDGEPGEDGQADLGSEEEEFLEDRRPEGQPDGNQGAKNNGETGMAPENVGSKNDSGKEEKAAGDIEESGSYTSKDEVALYLHVYGCLPDNFITKKEAENLGWNSKEGNLWEVAPGMSIGGSRFGNYEGALPDKKGRKYFECDIDYEGGYRGAKRLIYSDDGLIFYTEDHYNTFEQLYGE